MSIGTGIAVAGISLGFGLTLFGSYLKEGMALLAACLTGRDSS